MNTHGVRLVCFTVVLLIFRPSPLPLASGVRIVRLSLAQGDVQIDRNSGDGWEQAINNMPVIGGARIYAAENSKAELEFEDGSSVRLVGPGASITDRTFLRSRWLSGKRRSRSIPARSMSMRGLRITMNSASWRRPANPLPSPSPRICALRSIEQTASLAMRMARRWFRMPVAMPPSAAVKPTTTSSDSPTARPAWIAFRRNRKTPGISSATATTIRTLPPARSTPAVTIPTPPA